MARKYRDFELRPRNLDEQGAAQIVGKLALFRRMVASGWITPVVNKHSCVLFADHHVQAACDLLQHGYYPGEREPEPEVVRAAKDGAYRAAYGSVT